MIIYIYNLTDPRNNEVRYVGKTGNLQYRLKEHLTIAKRGEGKSEWITELLNNNLSPIMNVLEETTEDKWSEVEGKWIIFYLQQGAALFNILGTGTNFHKHSLETKIRISKNRKGKNLGNKSSLGRFQSEETKEKIRNSRIGKPGYWKGKKFSEETRKKMSEATKGRKLSIEHIEKIRRANLGKKLSDETKEKLRQVSLTRVYSEEEKQRLRELNKGRVVSEETRLKRSRSLIGKKRTEEQKIKQSRTQQENWNNPEYKAKMLEAQKRRREREAQEKAKK